MLSALLVSGVGSITAILAVRPAGAAGDPPRVVVIPWGASARQVAGALADGKVIRSRWAFLILATFRGNLRLLKPGEYKFAMPASLPEVEATLAEGRTVTYLVTIPEGFTVREVAARLSAEAIGDANRIQALAQDEAFLRRLGLDAPSLEGYLFPDTYQLSKGMSEGEILRRMVDRFREVFGGPEEERARTLGLDRHAIVTLASIIEKEAHVEEERRLISAVFHNRLRRQMPLQADPSILYSYPERRGRLTQADLRRADPYNTYTKPGLPPGPIANPGRASLQAALDPAPVDHLYFVARQDGTHAFSRTLAEHERAVRRYQRPRREGGEG